MRSERPRKPALLALALALLSCSCDGLSVGCSPTLSCSLRAESFDQPEEVDAGPLPCERDAQECNAVGISAGRAHTCGVTKAGEVFCWGDHRKGQLGARISSDYDAGLEPVLGGVQQVAAGGDHTCAIADGSVFCWGHDGQGQVDGVATSQAVREPVELGITAALRITAGAEHSCALTEDGALCWGSARFGQIGHSVADEVHMPELVPGTSGALEISAGARHTCALFGDGRVTCWGEQLDPESGEPRSSAEPTPVPELSDARAISAGAGHTCALRARGEVACWGRNDFGQLGDGTRASSAVPVTVEQLEIALAIGAGGTEQDGMLAGHSCAVTKSFFVQCWGRNAEGQLGIGRTDDSLTAMVVLGEPDEDDEPYLPDLLSLAVGGLHTCALEHEGDVLCWGDDSLAQLGLDDDEERVFGRVVNEADRFGGAQPF